jgi:hypothetical protein
MMVECSSLSALTAGWSGCTQDAGNIAGTKRRGPAIDAPDGSWAPCPEGNLDDFGDAMTAHKQATEQ